MKIEIGDHLVSPRCGYTHHGLYVGNGNVIHYGGYSKIKSDGVIMITSLADFSQDNSVRVRQHISRVFSHEESVERAQTRLGEDWYNVLLNNCEHFVTWCIYGLPNSRQVNNLILCAIGYKVLKRKAATKAIAAMPIPTFINSSIVGKRTADFANLAASASSSSLVSASSATGLTSLASGLSFSAVGGVLVGATSIAGPIVPLAAVVAAGYLVEYGVSKLFD